MIKTNNTRGFTLIELLVVIAIIGILASVVLASLNSARDKGEDAAVKQQLSSIRAEAEISYDDNSRSYDNVCTDVTALGANVPGFSCNDSATAWAAQGTLNGTNQFYCVDSTGVAETNGTSKGTATACP